MKQELIDSIRSMLADGCNLRLPAVQLPNYAEVKKTLIKAGGVYKRGGYFEFQSDAAAIQDRLCGGEIMDDKKEFQFFQTPDALAERMVEKAGIEAHHDCLEPSAGLGAIAKQILQYSGLLICVEIVEARAQELEKLEVECIQNDFLLFEPAEYFDRIVANPPFTKQQDIAHILHMYEHLKPGGRMVTLSAPGWRFRENTLSKEFRAFIDLVGAEIEYIPAGTFKKSGTNIETVMITIDKPE